MVLYSLTSPDTQHGSQVLWKEDERVCHRGWREGGDGAQRPALFIGIAAAHPSRSSLDQLRHEFELKEELDRTWSARPMELLQEAGRTVLVLEDPGGEPLERLLGAPMEIARFLRLAIGIAVALGKLHQCGLVHKDIKPIHILAVETSGEVHLTGFGIASRLARERQSPHAPETLAGTLAYMAPEQTGRMNRSVDSRSDLYALGVVLYQMLTGALPFSAAEPMGWVHCHLARRPISPAERLEIPPIISAIVMKLLAKRAEDRYQTAAGLERDLRRCHSDWEPRHRIEDFPLGERDTPDRLMIPEKLYGREGEVETLLTAFDRIVRGGSPELLLVSGYSGIGKSSVVNELQPVLVPPRALFASGKFDQYQRDIPYATLAQAFQSLIRQLLFKSESDLALWREALRDTIGPDAGLIVSLVPEIKHIIGEPPPLPELPPQDAQRRFQLVVHRFIGAFARPEHPLALFLDDLQWLDAATLDLLESLLTRSDLQHLLLIGAYRDNEVNPVHPLMRKLDAIKTAGGKVSVIMLEPLGAEQLGQLMADTLHCEPRRSAPLAQLVHRQTGGNPFFTIQFVSSLAEEGMLTFDPNAASWSWDLDRIHAKGYTDNVVDLMVGKLIRLSDPTQTALQQLACLGSFAEIETLSTVLDAPEPQVLAALWESVRQGFIERRGDSFKFIHDRVQEAAYSLIPEGSRAAVHLRIGRLLLACRSGQPLNEAVFDIVNHLNRGATLLDSQDERDQLAELNLTAGRRAKASTAWASALKYFIAGAAVLGSDRWERLRNLSFTLEIERAQCEFLCSQLAAAEERLTALSRHAADTTERAALACLHISICLELLQPGRAVAACLDYLKSQGIEISARPTEDEVRREYAQIWAQLGGRTIEEIAELPAMSDAESLATLEVLLMAGIPAAMTDENFNCWTICRAVNISLEHGNSDASCLAYAVFSRPAVQYFRDYGAAFRFGRVGVELVERRGLKRFEARTLFWFADLSLRWMRPLRSCVGLLQRALDAANEIGDFTFVNVANHNLSSELLIAGEALSNVERQAELGLRTARKAQFSGEVIMLPLLALIRGLRGLTSKFGHLDCGDFQELAFERLCTTNPNMQNHECSYLILKVQARYFAGDYAAAVEASSRAQEQIKGTTCQANEAEFHFFSALSRAASCESGATEDREQHREALARHQCLLELWAENCPENFESRAALIGAEIARIEDRDLDAMNLYEKAIRSSRANGFIHNEALAYERASVFYRARGFEQFADICLRNARACYASWGADGKVRQLDRMYPALKQELPAPGPASTISAPIEGLDLATVIRVSKAVSGEIELEKLLETVMREAMEQAGAERGLLIIPRGDGLHVEAQSKTSGNDVVVRLGGDSTDLPESIVRYVMRTGESVIIDDALSSNAFSVDPYIYQHRVRSILCLPLLNQAKLSGVLYLENNLAPQIFTVERIAVLKVLASQAAISLENTRLYRDLADREAKIRRLVDANIIGIFIWEHGGRILDANVAFLRTVGYERCDIDSGRLHWTDLTPPEWLDRDVRQLLPELETTGTLQPFEKEYFRKDGSRVPVLVGIASFDATGKQGVAFVIDLSERNRAEQALRQLESDLAHVNRLSMLGVLTASLAHEIMQPIATASNNARAALNFMTARPPELDEVKEAIGCILGDADRARGIVDRIRDQIKKTPPRKDRFDLNAAISEVLELARSTITQYSVSVQPRLAEELIPVHGDRIQLQQVLLNLIVNAVEAMELAEVGARELSISTEQDSEAALVSVRDTGPGIDSGDLERIFGAFYTTKTSGLGMGLSICRSIIDAHGGRLWAGSNEPRGAVFRFTLPRAEGSS